MKELAGVPREWIKRFAESGWELMYHTRQGILLSTENRAGYLFLSIMIQMCITRKSNFLNRRDFAMAFGEFAASELSDEENSCALTDFDRYLAGSGLVQPLPSYF